MVRLTQAVRHAISGGDLTTGTVLCSNDQLAIGFLAACYERGLGVGRGPECDLRVAAHDGHPFSRFTCPALTTAAHHYNAVAHRSVETLFGLIDEGPRTAVICAATALALRATASSPLRRTPPSPP